MQLANGPALHCRGCCAASAFVPFSPDSSPPVWQVKRVDAGVGYGGDWTVHIEAVDEEASAAESELPQRISLLFYVANEDVQPNPALGSPVH